LSRKGSLIVVESQPKSPAERGGIRKGDQLISINGHFVEDPIDFHFYSTENILNCRLKRNDQEYDLAIEPIEGEPLGLTFEPMKYSTCGNKCSFCFVDQNPPDMRATLYFKDEDFRMSFLYGNYVTLTRTTDDDLERIIEQRLAPLYVSIHAVNSEVRKKLLGLKKDDHLLDKIKLLADNRIEMHAQIVLCRNLNDESILAESIRTLSEFYPAIRSLAVVPVGLTKYRDSLPAITGFDSASAPRVLEQAEQFQKEFQKKFEEPWVYFADEFYLLAGKVLPSEEHYGQFWQTGNGVGLTREFLSIFAMDQESFPLSVKKKSRFVLVTGVLAAPIIEKHVVPALNKIKNVTAELCVVENHLFGNKVTVSGLLCGSDIIRAVCSTIESATLLLPPNCVNNDDLFLDDMTIVEMEQQLNCKVVIVDTFLDLWDN